jgi:microsomal dipeptidase-like Zn-dependent dipeptidase
VRRPAIAAILALALLPGTAQGAKAPVRPANRCFVLKHRPFAARFFFKPTGLGTFMLMGRGGRLLGVGDSDRITRFDLPGPVAEWTLRRAGRFVTLRSISTARQLVVTPKGTLGLDTAIGPPARFTLRARRGCHAYPEAALNALGKPFRGKLPDGTVFGFADGHLHLAADLRGGGRVISGRAFDRFGITEALGHDADVHGADGSMDITGNLLRGGAPTDTHDTHGWPSFKGWPTFDTYTHQQTYYRWLQRMYMAGMRLVVAQVVEDQPLCDIEPSKSHSCDETDTIKLQVTRLKEMQDYVDAQSGGRGRGWLRLVYDPAQARQAIERGQMAMILGVESSSPFGCKVVNGQPQCDKAQIDAGLALYQHLGIRVMFIAHWIDNAFAGAALEGGDKGTFISLFQTQSTGTPFLTGPCPEEGQGEEVGPLPGRMCNTKGLTELGRYLVGKLIDAHMLIEADHLSERSRVDLLELAEARHYPLVSSHNGTGGFWTASDLQRLHALGGYVGPNTADTAADMDKKIGELGGYGFGGVGLGTDTGGFAALPGPDPEASHDPLRYPFRSFDGRVRFGRQVTGTRSFDINTDGVAHYGLLADFLANMARGAGGQRAMNLLFHSAEAYLETWERAARSR